MTDEVLVRADNLCKYFKVAGGRYLHAVEDVTLEIHRGETLGLVGESGCGKSTLGRTMMGIYPPTKGKLYYGGNEVNLADRKSRFAFAKKAQIVFQDPYASLDPRMTVASIISEGMEIHNLYDEKKRQERVGHLLDIVGLNREHASRFPHEFSGGQRQRIGIARALAIEPEFIVCDEPISALDVSIQAQVINLLHDQGSIKWAVSILPAVRIFCTRLTKTFSEEASGTRTAYTIISCSERTSQYLNMDFSSGSTINTAV